MNLDLLTNATVVDDAIRFVSQQSRQDLKSSHNAMKMTKNQTSLIMTKTKIS